jgi:hypothetical protein
MPIEIETNFHFWSTTSTTNMNKINWKTLISYRKRSEMNVKAAEIQSFPATLPHFPAETTFKVLSQYRCR